MKNKSQWVSRFKDLDPIYQLDIAKAIIEELSLNEESLDDDEYDKKKSETIKELFKKYIVQAKDKSELFLLQELLNAFNNLSELDKKEFIIRMYNSLTPYLKEVEKREKNKKIQDKRREKREFCKMNGHDFGDWKEKNWITYEECGVTENIFAPPNIIEVKRTKWYRSCKYCGTVQTRYTKPNMVEANEIKEKIKVLQKELARLEDK